MAVTTEALPKAPPMPAAAEAPEGGAAPAAAPATSSGSSFDEADRLPTEGWQVG